MRPTSGSGTQSRDDLTNVICRLDTRAQWIWRRQHGFEQLAKVVSGRTVKKGDGPATHPRVGFQLSGTPGRR